MCVSVCVRPTEVNICHVLNMQVLQAINARHANGKVGAR